LSQRKFISQIPGNAFAFADKDAQQFDPYGMAKGFAVCGEFVFREFLLRPGPQIRTTAFLHGLVPPDFVYRRMAK
jgi:hypothetical protein